ncbi:hypothetical protein CEXT_175741 [Caerostris extrusa]|uniref:Uncharacterized protein n=1 Tax=Caerostris extrusa TaxID=172846 RepID=A0AAV4MDC0_CAEEX|nr:hypothetical protein CEXT_175741 [Caerostris extrusa]
MGLVVPDYEEAASSGCSSTQGICFLQHWCRKSLWLPKAKFWPLPAPAHRRSLSQSGSDNAWTVIVDF